MAQHDVEVSKLDRDLRFFPVRTPSPHTLGSSQIDFYNRNGYLTGLRAYGPEEADANRRNFDNILRQFLEQGKDSYSIDRYQHRYATLWDIATHRLICDHVEDLLGPNFVCWATHYFCKMPGDEKGVSWHQDCSYWPLTPSKTVTVWLAIDDVDRENGCMQVIPATHLLGHLSWVESEASEHNVLTQTIRSAEKLGTAVDIELRSGEFSMHSDLLVHGSLPNRSNRRRCGLTLRYCPVDVHAEWNWGDRAILCRGTDPAGHWGNVPRPAEGAEPRR